MLPLPEAAQRVALLSTYTSVSHTGRCRETERTMKSAWRNALAGGLVISSTACSGTPSDAWQPHPDIAALLQGAEDCSEVEGIAFTMRSVESLNRDLAVSAIVPLPSGASLISTTNGQLYVLAADSLVVLKSDPIAYLTSSPSGSAVALTRAGKLVEFTDGGGSSPARNRLLGHVPFSWGTIQGLAVASGALWIVTAENGTWTLYRRAVDGDTGLPIDSVRAFDVPVWVRTLTNSSVVVGTVEPPFATWMLASGGTTVGRFETSTAQEQESLARWASLGVWPLDCGAVVHVVADLASRQRRLVVRRLKSGGGIVTLEDRMIDQPLGIVASHPQHRKLITLMDRGDAWELQHIEWSWSTRTDNKGMEE